MTLSGTTTQAKSGPGSNGNEEVLYIFLISRTGDSSSDGCIISGAHVVEGVFLSAEILPACSNDPVDRARCSGKTYDSIYNIAVGGIYSMLNVSPQKNKMPPQRDVLGKTIICI